MPTRLAALTVALSLTGFAQAQSLTFGQFEGSWNNTTFGSTGGASILFEDLGGGTVGLTVDLDGGVFGQGDPGPLSVTGSLAGDVFTLNPVVGDPVYGDISGTVDAGGTVMIDLINAAGGGFGLVELRGTAVGSSISLTYDIFLSAQDTSPFAVGVITATLIPSPSAVAVLGLGGLAVGRRRR